MLRLGYLYLQSFMCKIMASLNFTVNSLRVVLLLCAGKYYYEATVTDEGLCRVGWATDRATLNLGTDKEGYGFGGTGKKSFNKQFDDYGEVGFISVIVC